MAGSRNMESESPSELRDQDTESPVKSSVIPPTQTLTSEQAAIIRRLSQPTILPLIAPGKFFLTHFLTNIFGPKF